MNSDIAPEPDGYYEAISDDDSLGGVEDKHENDVNGANQERDSTFSLDFEALPFVPKFSSEIRNTVEAATMADNASAGGGFFVGNWGQENCFDSETQMECPYFPSEHGTVTMPRKGGDMKESAELQNPIKSVQQGTPSQSLAHPLPSKDHDTCTGLNENQLVASDPPSHIEDIGLSGESSISENKEMHQGKSSVVDVTDTQSAQSSVIDSNKIEESHNWLDENGDPIQGAFDQIEPEVKGDSCVSMVNNTRVEYVFHVKEKTAVASHIENISTESVNSQGSEACFGNVASTSNLSLEDSNTGGESSASHVEREEYDQKKLYEASKNKEEYHVAALAASSSATNEEKKIEDSETKPKERFNRFKRNRFLDQTTTQETEVTTQPVKSEAEIALESQALTEILREVKQGAQRAKEYGALGWQKCPVPVVNKTFLRNTLVSTLREPYRPPQKRGQRHVGLEGRKPYDGDSHSRSSSRSSRSDSRSRSSSGSRSRSRSSSRSSRDSRSRSRSHDSKRRKGFRGRSQRGHWPRGGPQNMYYDWQAMEAYMAQYGYPWYGHEAYAMYFEEGWPMDMYYGDPRAWAQYQSYYRGFPPRGRGHRGRGRGFYGNRWAEEEEVVYSDDEDFSSSSLSPSPSPDKDGPGESSSTSSKRHNQQAGKGSREKLSKKDSDGSKVKTSKKSKAVESGNDEESESGAKQRKKKKKKKKKKKHKKMKKDEIENTTSKKGEGEQDSSHEASKSEDHILKNKSDDPKAKNENQDSTKAKKKVVKKKAKVSEGIVTDASGAPPKKKKKLVTSKTIDKTGADSKEKGKGKGKSKVKKKMSPKKKTECATKGEHSAKHKDGQEIHVNVKGEGSTVDGNDAKTSVSENRKASTEDDQGDKPKASSVDDQGEKPTPCASSMSDTGQEMADTTNINQGFELSFTNGAKASSSHEHSESQKEEQKEANAIKTIPDGRQEDTVIERVDRGIEKPDIVGERNVNENMKERKTGSRRNSKDSLGQENARETESSGERQSGHDIEDPKCKQVVNTKDVQAKKRESSQMDCEKDVQTSKKTRKNEICLSHTEKHNRHTDSKAGTDENTGPSSDLRVEGKKKEKKRKRELKSDGQVHHRAKRKRGDSEHDRDKGQRGRSRNNSSEKVDEAEEQQEMVTGSSDERRITKEKIADGDKGKTYADKGQKGRDKGKTYADKGQKGGDKGKTYADKGEKGGDKGKRNAEKRKRDGDKGKTEGDYRKTIIDKGKGDADEKKTDRRVSTPVLLDAREKIKEKRRMRELERQRGMKSHEVIGDVEKTKRENLKKSPSREDSHNPRHKQSGKDMSCDEMSAFSRKTPGKSEKREKKSKRERAHIQDQVEVEKEGLEDKLEKTDKLESDTRESKLCSSQERKV